MAKSKRETAMETSERQPSAGEMHLDRVMRLGLILNSLDDEMELTEDGRHTMLNSAWEEISPLFTRAALDWVRSRAARQARG